ncbi:MAG: family transcriptional regulator [Acidobacteria bacterium]|nr:family transcriptional regulator [Acidobacteriota bacterium]
MPNNRKRRPTHPGEILREDVLPAAGLTRDKLARLLGVSRRTISEILHERQSVTTDMAHRLARALGTSPEMWQVYSRTSISGTHITLDAKNTNASNGSQHRKQNND